MTADDLDHIERAARDVLAAVERLRAALPPPAPADDEPGEVWLSEAEAARAVNRTAEALRSHRRQGSGPPWRRSGRGILYRAHDLADWIARGN